MWSLGLAVPPELNCRLFLSHNSICWQFLLHQEHMGLYWPGQHKRCHQKSHGSIWAFSRFRSWGLICRREKVRQLEVISHLWSLSWAVRSSGEQQQTCCSHVFISFRQFYHFLRLLNINVQAWIKKISRRDGAEQKQSNVFPDDNLWIESVQQKKGNTGNKSEL